MSITVQSNTICFESASLVCLSSIRFKLVGILTEIEQREVENFDFLFKGAERESNRFEAWYSCIKKVCQKVELKVKSSDQILLL